MGKVEYKLIELKEWQRTGASASASASSYVKKNDDNYMLKLFNKNIEFKVIENEYTLAKIVFITTTNTYFHRFSFCDILTLPI